MRDNITVSSISWIDSRGLPNIGFWDAASALTNWQNRVMIGLVATANPKPPEHIDNIESFRTRKQYRALVSASISLTSPINISSEIIDPGWTPPIDRSKINTSIAKIMPLGKDPKFYPGEASAISSTVIGQLHPSSTISLPKSEDRVLISMLIKFRAGSHTNKIGIEDANSPVHVPWVWCETVLIVSNKEFYVIGAGSHFPSHAWYVNGKQIAMSLQQPVDLSVTEPAISTGRPANQPRVDAGSDKSTGVVTGHEYVIPSGATISKKRISKEFLL